MAHPTQSLQPVIEGSRTPRVTDKVLAFLHGMSATQPESPLSHHSSEFYDDGPHSQFPGPNRVSIHGLHTGDAMEVANLNEQLYMDGGSEVSYPVRAQDFEGQNPWASNRRSGASDPRHISHGTGPSFGNLGFRESHDLRHISHGSGPSFGNIAPRESQFSAGIPEEVRRDLQASPYTTLQFPLPGTPARGVKNARGDRYTPKPDFSFDVVPPSQPGSKLQTPVRSAAPSAAGGIPRDEREDHVGSFSWEHAEQAGDGNGWSYSSFEQKAPHKPSGRQPESNPGTPKASPSRLASVASPTSPNRGTNSVPASPFRNSAALYQKGPTPHGTPQPYQPPLSPFRPVEQTSQLGLFEDGRDPGRPTSPSMSSVDGSDTRLQSSLQSSLRSPRVSLFESAASSNPSRLRNIPPETPPQSLHQRLSMVHPQTPIRSPSPTLPTPGANLAAVMTDHFKKGKNKNKNRAEASFPQETIPSMIPPAPFSVPNPAPPPPATTNFFSRPMPYARAPAAESVLTPVPRRAPSPHGSQLDDRTLLRSPAMSTVAPAVVDLPSKHTKALSLSTATAVRSDAVRVGATVGPELEDAFSPHVQSHSHEIINFTPDHVPRLASPPPSTNPSRITSPLSSLHIRNHSFEQFEGHRKSLIPVAAPAPVPTPADENTPRASQAGDLAPGEMEIDENQLVELLKTPYSVATTAILDDNDLMKYHDEDLCILLHAAEDDNQPDVVKRAVRRAVKSRVKRLGLEHEATVLRTKIQAGQGNAAYKQLRDRQQHRHAHDDDIGHHPQSPPPQRPSRSTNHLVRGEQPPTWAEPLFAMLRDAHARLDGLDNKFDYGRASEDNQSRAHHQRQAPSHDAGRDYGRYEEEELDDDDEEGTVPKHHHRNTQSPGEQYFEEELFKLRVKQRPRSETNTHQTWEVGTTTHRNAPPTEFEEDDPDEMGNIPDTLEREAAHGYAPVPHAYKPYPSPPLPPLPDGASLASRSELGYHDQHGGASAQDQSVGFPEPHPAPGGNWPAHVWASPGGPGVSDTTSPPPWLRVHQRLLSWAIVWPITELEQAAYSTEKGQQIDEVGLTIWSTQVYKRYVRATLTHSPPGPVDRLFIPPNMADAINNAVFNGRHGDAAEMLRELWSPFGFDGIPRLLLVLSKHRRDENHWVVHKFNLPEGSLITFDTYPKKALPDGRPLGWWFAIRIAWPNPMYPTPDRLVQRMMRLTRPTQPPSDNACAAAAIWRNLVMGSKPERQLDLDRLRDLMKQEIKNLITRKNMGKLSISKQQPRWQSATD